MTMECFTDYPTGSMRQGTIVGYDHNKYLAVDFGDAGNIEEIKAGYCYRTRRKVPYQSTTLMRAFPAPYYHYKHVD